MATKGRRRQRMQSPEIVIKARKEPSAFQLLPNSHNNVVTTEDASSAKSKSHQLPPLPVISSIGGATIRPFPLELELLDWSPFLPNPLPAEAGLIITRHDLLGSLQHIARNYRSAILGRIQVPSPVDPATGNCDYDSFSKALQIAQWKVNFSIMHTRLSSVLPSLIGMHYDPPHHPVLAYDHVWRITMGVLFRTICNGFLQPSVDHLYPQEYFAGALNGYDPIFEMACRFWSHEHAATTILDFHDNQVYAYLFNFINVTIGYMIKAYTSNKITQRDYTILGGFLSKLKKAIMCSLDKCLTSPDFAIFKTQIDLANACVRVGLAFLTTQECVQVIPYVEPAFFDTFGKALNPVSEEEVIAGDVIMRSLPNLVIL